jgi:hypothetical protein
MRVNSWYLDVSMKAKRVNTSESRVGESTAWVVGLGFSAPSDFAVTSSLFLQFLQLFIIPLRSFAPRNPPSRPRFAHVHSTCNMPVPVPPPRTLYDKIWDDHVVCVLEYPADEDP